MFYIILKLAFEDLQLKFKSVIIEFVIKQEDFGKSFFFFLGNPFRRRGCCQRRHPLWHR